MMSRLSDRTLLLVLSGVAAGLTLWSALTSGLNQDARFVLGSLGAGWPVTDTWAHRPLMFRLVMAPLAGFPPTPVAEAALRLVMLLPVVGATCALAWGLHRETRHPWFIAGVVGVALAWAPGWDFAEPEWLATVLCAAAIGLALRSSDQARPDSASVRAAAMGGASVLLAVAALLKLTTVTQVAVAIGAVGWCRGGYAALMLAWRAVTVGGIAFVLTILVADPEYLWLTEMAALNPPLGDTAVRDLAEGVANLLLTSPITVVALACLPLVWRARRRAAVSVVLAAVILAAPFVVQHQNFLYHLAAIPSLCAGMVAVLATHPRTARRAGPVAALAGVGASGGAGLLWLFPEPLRDAHWEWAGLALLCVAPLAWGVLHWWGARRSPRRSPPRRWFAVLALLPLLIPIAPLTAYSYSLAHRETTNLANRALAEPLEIPGVPADAPVLYLSFAAPYRMANPSTCHYVSPTWLQRAADRPQVARTRSFERNLGCVYDPRARFVIIETGWFDLPDTPPQVRRAIDSEFDCSRPVGTAEGFMACPHR